MFRMLPKRKSLGYEKNNMLFMGIMKNDDLSYWQIDFYRFALLILECVIYSDAIVQTEFELIYGQSESRLKAEQIVNNMLQQMSDCISTSVFWKRKKILIEAQTRFQFGNFGFKSIFSVSKSQFGEIIPD